MKKQTFRISIVFVLIFVLSTYGYASGKNENVKDTKISMVIEDQLIQTKTYIINGTNYLKLRDISNLLKHTDMAFDINWDSETGETHLVLGGKSQTEESEDYSAKSITKIATPNEISLKVNGKRHILHSYMIDNNNYINLRDIINIIGGKLDWDEETNTVHISTKNSLKTLKALDLGQNKSDNKLYATDYTLYIGQNPIKGVYKIGDRLYFAFENLKFNNILREVVSTTNDRLNGDAYEGISLSPSRLKNQDKVLAAPQSFIDYSYVGMVSPMKRYLVLRKESDEKVIIKNALYSLGENLVMVDLKALGEVTDLRYDHESKSIYLFEDMQPKGSVSVEEDLVNNAMKSLNLQGKTNPQKIEIIHDYIVKHLEYDTSYYGYDTKDAIKTEKARAEAYEKFKFVNNVTLTAKTGVCEDYAILFQEMSTRTGVPVTFQHGYSSGENHLWNRAYFKDQWRFVDATWDDPITTSKNSKSISREYFDPSLEKLQRTHSWSGSDYKMPEYDNSWQNLIHKTADTPDMFRKVVIANFKNHNTNFVVKTKGNSTFPGIGFINHYFREGDIGYYTLYATYDKKANGYRFNVEY